MGARESRPGSIAYEDALRRVSEGEVRRLRETFRRASPGAPLSRAAFTQHVLGGWAPGPLAERLYSACGPSRRGLPFRDLLCALVLLAKGKQDERIRFLWSLYYNEAGTHIVKSEFIEAVKLELASLPAWKSSNINTNLAMAVMTLFGNQGDKVNFETFRSWLLMRKNATIFSHWLLLEPSVNLTSDLETPTFYQSLAGVTHLEEKDICVLEKYFWHLIGNSPSGQLDSACLGPLLSPPIPRAALNGLLLALDENRDGHVDFKELCCGLSAACRGPVSERVKFCFKIFDSDRDGMLNQNELQHMINMLCYVANESLNNQNNYHLSPRKNKYEIAEDEYYRPEEIFESLKDMMTLNSYTNTARKRSKELIIKNNNSYVTDISKSSAKAEFALNEIAELPNSQSENKEEWGLSQENFLIWHVDKGNKLIAPFLQLIFQVCHIVLGLRPQCKHQENEIVVGWLNREVRRGYSVGQFWYLISAEWWNAWLTYTGSNGVGSSDKIESCIACGRSSQRSNQPVDEAIVCDENFNNSEWSGDLLGRADTGSLGSGSSSSGVSSNGSSHSSRPGPIDNSSLLAPNPYDVRTLTGEGGHLRKDLTLVENKDFILVPDSLWKALAQWYGGPQPLPRQVIQPPKSDVEIELYPRNLRLMRHMPTNTPQASTTSWSGMVGGYGAAALSTVGAASYQTSSLIPNRYLAYTAAFSRLATIKQVGEFICIQTGLSREDVRLWLVDDSTLNPEDPILTMLEEESLTLSQINAIDGQKVLIEVRNKDLTWPEEMGALSKSAMSYGNKRNTVMNTTPAAAPHPPGATGLQNLGNTCFMNAALQAVWNTGPLTCYFTRGMHLFELNLNNPLGTRGALAQRYGELCKEVWSCGIRSIAPLRVRLCICQNADRFSGGGQHDSQELLAWLLDALHEDLNRVNMRMYKELGDSDGRPDQVVAQEAWEQHTARNQSIITELFYGQLKSKVTCSKCKHESVRFDPFNMLSLPLPMESYILAEVIVVLLDGTVPFKYGIRLNSEGRYKDLRDALSALCGIESEHLLLAEVSGPKITNLIDLYLRLRPGPTALALYAYELPPTAFYARKPSIFVTQDPADTVTMCVESSAGPERLSSSSESGSPTNNFMMGHNNNVDEIAKETVEACNGLKDSPRAAPGSVKFTPKASPTLSLKHRANNNNETGLNGDSNDLKPCYLVAIHRKQTRQDMYFLSQHKSKSELFGLPLLVPIFEGCTSKQLYTSVWTQVARFLSIPPVTPPDQANHATDCDDSLGYTFPFTLRLVNCDGLKCACCPWTRFCRGCTIPCSDEPFIRNLTANSNTASGSSDSGYSYSPTKQISPSPSPKLQRRGTKIEDVDENIPYNYQVNYIDFQELYREQLRCQSRFDKFLMYKLHIAIDWDPTALHLRYQSTREKDCVNHQSVAESRKLHAAAVQIQHCLNAFTSEEQLEQGYSCSKCQTSQPATKKLQIWRLPPILIIHLKRFQYVNNKWSKSQKVVNFPYKDFDPTAYLASIPQETILRHSELKQYRSRKNVPSYGEFIEKDEMDESNEKDDDGNLGTTAESSDDDDDVMSKSHRPEKTEPRKNSVFISNRERLESTSLIKTPVLDDNFVDYHRHKLKPGEDAFDLKYRLYAVVSHSGMMNGGHYVSYAHNPSGAWYCYNDSSCKELTPSMQSPDYNEDITPVIDPSSAYMLFYERKGLDYEPYLPSVVDRAPVISETELADGEDRDFKNMCSIS